ncbi:MAG: hypothetical protein JSU01_04985 [Bacteroidetes bacterium]|nr:hypothetical protein [Bacteroidota bacterium]
MVHPHFSKNLLFIICLLLLTSSCANHTYTSALYHHDIAYQPKPASFDSTKTATYLSGGMNLYTDPTWADFISMGQANLSRAHVFKNANLSYGVFGAVGDYQAGTSGNSPYNFTHKYFEAVGARISGDLYTPYERMDFRYIGFEASYSREFGAYADFRKFLSQQPQFRADTRTELYTLGLTSEILFHNENDVNIQHGLRVFLGVTFGPNPYTGTNYISQDLTPKPFSQIFPRVSYFLKVHDFFAVIEAGSEFSLRAGVKF